MHCVGTTVATQESQGTQDNPCLLSFRTARAIHCRATIYPGRKHISHAYLVTSFTRLIVSLRGFQRRTFATSAPRRVSKVP